MKIDEAVRPADLEPLVARMAELASAKTQRLAARWNPADGAPVFTAAGRYTTRGWTDWTQGFQYGCAILAFEATGDQTLLEIGRRGTVERMAPHVTHVGMHDHGFNSVSTYGNLRRLMRKGRIPHSEWELAFYEMALKASGAVQAARWAEFDGGYGYIYSFNGPQSLFVDTMRTLRILGVAHQLGHVLMGEGDRKISLLGRLVRHGLTTAAYNIYYGAGRDVYDTPGRRRRTAHEAIFNATDGRYRCPNSQQGYSPFSTWTRGLAWAMLGFAEELEFLATRPAGEFGMDGLPAQADMLATFRKAAEATADFYVRHAATADGVCYWDTGAPGLLRLGDYLARPAEPFNEEEPVDASAAAIAAQGLIRLGRYLATTGDETHAQRYTQAGLTIARTLLAEPYLSTEPGHEGLLLHSVYHRPNGWDYVPPGRKVPCGESSLWGDYHLLELGLLVSRMARGSYVTFFD